MTDKNAPDEADNTDEDEDDSLADLAKSVEERRESDEQRSLSRNSRFSPSDSADEFIWVGSHQQSDDETSDSDSQLNLDDAINSEESPDSDDAAVISEAGRQKLMDADNILILGPLRGAKCDGTCVSLLTTPRADSVLFVTAMHSVEDRLEALREHADSMPDRVSVIRVGVGDRVRERSTLSRPDGPTELAVEGVEDPSDLTRLGIAINRSLSEWDDEGQTRICIHSLTELLQYVDKQRLFKFVHILQAKLEKEDTVTHFHLNPSSHSMQTVSVFRTLFDYVVKVAEDGSVTVTETDD